MADFLVRDIPKRTYDKLRRIAKRENLSINQVTLKLIYRALDRFDQELIEAEEYFSLHGVKTRKI